MDTDFDVAHHHFLDVCVYLPGELGSTPSPPTMDSNRGSALHSGVWRPVSLCLVRSRTGTVDLSSARLLLCHSESSTQCWPHFSGLAKHV